MRGQIVWDLLTAEIIVQSFECNPSMFMFLPQSMIF